MLDCSRNQSVKIKEFYVTCSPSTKDRRMPGATDPPGSCNQNDG